MNFRVILLSNGVFKKTLHKSKRRKTAFINYHKLIESNKVLYPKRFINSVGIKRVKYQICVVKESEPNDEFRLLRDAYGKLYTETPIGDWTVITSETYEVEETFTIYGYELEIRPNIKEIIKRLMINAHAKNSVKQIIVVYNKLLIYNENQFEMIICKNKEDAQRLHHTLAKISKKQKIKSLLFMGTASPTTTSLMYDLIHSKTGWSYNKIRRTSTRP
jgi:hypothetical protein